MVGGLGWKVSWVWLTPPQPPPPPPTAGFINHHEFTVFVVVVDDWLAAPSHSLTHTPHPIPLSREYRNYSNFLFLLAVVVRTIAASRTVVVPTPCKRHEGKVIRSCCIGYVSYRYNYCNQRNVYVSIQYSIVANLALLTVGYIIFSDIVYCSIFCHLRRCGLWWVK